MSRIGKQPIAIPPKVKVEVNGQKVHVAGPKGKLDWELPRRTSLKVEGDKIVLTRANDDAQSKALHGLSRALVNNMVKGVSEGFTKNLEITGVGYRALKEGDQLVLTLGFSHPVRLTPPSGIQYKVDTPTKLSVNGIDKQVVGEEAAKIRSLRKAEPYKGKGIAYAGERIRRKAGKAGKVGAKK